MARWPSSSLWSAALPPEDRPGRPVPPSAELVVVGGGLAGLLCAVVAQRAGRDVVLLERHGLGGVTTRGSTGKLSALQGDRLASVAADRGADAARTYAEVSAWAVEALPALLDELGIDGGLARGDDHTYATTPEGARRAAEVLEAATGAGLPVSWSADLELPFPTLGAVRLAGQVRLDPGAVAAGLGRVLGPRAHPATPVLDVEEHHDRVVVTHPDGTIEADRVVVATLGPVHDPALLTTRCTPMRSYAVAAPHPAPPAGTYLSVDPSVRSIRAALVDGRSMVVVGGEGHLVGDPGDRSPAERYEALAATAAELGAGAVTHRWAAHDLVTSDHVPFVGRLHPGAHRTWVAAGFGKWGIGMALVAADLLERQAAGEQPAAASLLDPTRLADSATAKLAKDAVRSVRHLVVDRVADAVGGEHRPRCTHLGCVMDFDEAEGTWECGCHGSRFEANGTVVSGPAVAAAEV